MANGLTLIGKSITIAILAAVAAWAYLYAFTLSRDGLQALDWALGEASIASFLMALLGTFAVGLPVALFTYRFSAAHLAQSFTTLATVAVLAGIMLVLASYVLAREAGVLVLGIPAFIASITFALLGWFWILKPMRKGGVVRE
ncbi:MAG: hypothetical protein ACX930_01745 [Erythrobacter sp.]